MYHARVSACGRRAEGDRRQHDIAERARGEGTAIQSSGYLDEVRRRVVVSDGAMGTQTHELVAALTERATKSTNLR